MRPGKDYIVFPLDIASMAEALTYVRRLGDAVGLFKVGLELFIRCGPDVVAAIRGESAAGVFLDLKLHDIPQTVARAMAGVAALGVDLVTVHCGEDPRMLPAAVAAAGAATRVLAVTVLTSVADADLRGAGLDPGLVPDVRQLVRRRAEAARQAGCAGVVCSPWEAAAIKTAAGAGFLVVTPGIRPAWEGVGSQDQRRVTTPAEAVRAGADYLVVGRPIRDAADPVEAARRIAAEIEAAR